MPRTAVRSLLLLLTIFTACSSTTPNAKPAKISDAGVDAAPDQEALATPGMCPVLPDTCATTTPPSFQTDIAPIIAERCGSCHTGIGDAPWALDNWGDVAEWADLITVDLAACSMPPSDGGVSFPEHEREQVWTWAKCQTPNN